MNIVVETLGMKMESVIKRMGKKEYDQKLELYRKYAPEFTYQINVLSNLSINNQEKDFLRGLLNEMVNTL